MRQRIFALLLIGLSGTLAYLTLGYSTSFSYEPVGPRAFPWLLLGGLALAGVYLLLFEGKKNESTEPFFTDKKIAIKILLCIVNFLIYAALFETIGFILSSLIFSYGLARLYGATLLQTWLGMTVLVLSLYGLFEYIFDVPLPLGLLDIM